MARQASYPELDNDLAVVDLWMLFPWQADVSSAGPLLEPALAYCQKVGDRMGESHVLEHMGEYAARQLKNYDEGRRLHAEAFAIMESLGGRFWVAKETTLLATQVYFPEGNWAGAEQICLDALKVTREYADVLHTAGLLQTAAQAAMQMGKDAVAKERFEQSAALTGRSGLLVDHPCQS